MERFKIQRKQNDHEATPDKVDSSLIEQATSGQGQPLDESTRALLEPKFGHSFGNIRIFADDHAAKSAQALHANAYTVGLNIVFNAGRYQPDSSDGQRLIAHELTHTVQQGGVDGNQSLPSELEVNEPEDSYEQAAEQMAENVTASSASSSAKTISSGDDGMVQRDTLAEDTSILNQSKIVPVSMPRIPSLDSTQTSVQREPKKFTPIDPALRGDPVTKKVAQEQLLEWKNKTSGFIDANRMWLSGNYIDYLGHTSQNPHLSWSDSFTASVVSETLGNFLTELGEKAINKGSASVAGALVGTALAPGAGTVIGFIIGTLVEVAASAIFDTISGKTDADSSATEASERTAKLIQNRETLLNSASSKSRAELDKTYTTIQRKLTDSNSQKEIDDITTWAFEEKSKASISPPVSDRTLFKRMLAEWVLEHAGSKSSANSSTSQDQWGKNKDEIFGKDNGLNGHSDLFLYQTRSHWSDAGLSGDSYVQAIIKELSSTKSNEVGAKFSYRTYPFSKIQDIEKFMEFIAKERRLPSIFYTDNDLRLSAKENSCFVEVTINLENHADGTVVVSFWDYIVKYRNISAMTKGEEEVQESMKFSVKPTGGIGGMLPRA